MEHTTWKLQRLLLQLNINYHGLRMPETQSRTGEYRKELFLIMTGFVVFEIMLLLLFGGWAIYNLIFLPSLLRSNHALVQSHAPLLFQLPVREKVIRRNILYFSMWSVGVTTLIWLLVFSAFLLPSVVQGIIAEGKNLLKASDLFPFRIMFCFALVSMSYMCNMTACFFLKIRFARVACTAAISGAYIALGVAYRLTAGNVIRLDFGYGYSDSAWMRADGLLFGGSAVLLVVSALVCNLMVNHPGRKQPAKFAHKEERI